LFFDKICRIDRMDKWRFLINPRLSKNKAHLHNIATIFRREQGVQRFQRCAGEWHSVPQGAAAPWALLCNRFAVRFF